MAKRGSGDDRRGGRKAREKAAGAAAAERAGDRATAGRGNAPKAGSKAERATRELAKIERRLVEAQVILAEVTARADALEQRMRTLSGSPEPAAAGPEADPAGGPAQQEGPASPARNEWPVSRAAREGPPADRQD